VKFFNLGKVSRKVNRIETSINVAFMHTKKLNRKGGNEKRDSDEELVALFLKTQQNVYFEELYRRYAVKVYRRCLFFLKDSHRAEDLTQDIFLKLISRLNSYRKHARFANWVSRVTYNYCMDHIRMHKRKGEVPLEFWHDAGYGNFEHDDYWIANLRIAIGFLDFKETEILLMKYSDELSIREISNVLEITESAVKMRLLRSREILRTNLQRQLSSTSVISA
jgi:RNA polymerase sigma factor (sigma-70 family)